MVNFKDYKEMIRIFDIILIILLTILSFTPMGIFAWQQHRIPDSFEVIAIVTINGEEVDRFVLEKGAPRQLVTYTAMDGLVGNQYNIIEVEGARIRVKEDNSPDQIAVRTGWISRPGQTSICLPHRLMIRIHSLNPEQLDEDEIIIPF